MKMSDKGYIYTLVSVVLLLILLSLVFLYVEVSRMQAESTVKSIATDELHYFVESVKEDFSQAVYISGRRASSYAIDSVISTGEGLYDYSMVNCTPGFNYSGVGAQAAIAELMYCGTLYGSGTGEISVYMVNNTVRDWVNRTREKALQLNYDLREMELRNLSIMPYDAFHYMVVGVFDIVIYDRLGEVSYDGYSTPVVALVDVTGLEDPLFYTQTRNPALVRQFRECSPVAVVTGTVLDSWVDTGCYHSSSQEYAAPSFFDRLDGNLSLKDKYVGQSLQLANELGTTPQPIGLESLINLDEFIEYNTTVDVTDTWVDYLYWQNIDGNCTIAGMIYHPQLHLDWEHINKYEVVGRRCGHGVKVCGIDYFCGEDDGVCPKQFGVPCFTVIDPNCNGTQIDGKAYNCGGYMDGVCPKDAEGNNVCIAVTDLDC